MNSYSNYVALLFVIIAILCWYNLSSYAKEKLETSFLCSLNVPVNSYKKWALQKPLSAHERSEEAQNIWHAGNQMIADVMLTLLFLGRTFTPAL